MSKQVNETETRQGLVPEFQAIIEKGYAGHEKLYDDVWRMQHLVRCKIHELAVRSPKYWPNFESPLDKAEEPMHRAFSQGVSEAQSRWYNKIGPAGDPRWLAEYLKLFGERYPGHEDQLFDPWTNRKPQRWYPKKREKAGKSSRHQGLKRRTS